MSLFDIFKKKYNNTPQDNMPRMIYGTPDAMNRMREKQELKNKAKHSKTIFVYKEQYTDGTNGDKREFLFIVKKNGIVLTETLFFGFDTLCETVFKHDYAAHVINSALKQKKETIYKCEDSVSKDSKIKFEIKIGNKILHLDDKSYTGEIKEIIDTIVATIQSNAKYDIKPEDNRPAKVYGVPRPNKFD